LNLTLKRKTSNIYTVWNRTNIHILFFLLSMTDNMTSQNTDLSSWDILYIIIISNTKYINIEQLSTRESKYEIFYVCGVGLLENRDRGS